jgi:hypothetical protein
VADDVASVAAAAARKVAERKSDQTVARHERERAPLANRRRLSA